MTILGIDLCRLAYPADLDITDVELGTLIKMKYDGKCYTHIIGDFELLHFNSNDLLVQHIVNIIYKGRHQLGIKDTCSECTPRI